jgi:LacI family transcriptional regulator
MNERQNKVNIYELAKATGYSTSTVSKALNNTGRISETTVKKILEKANEMNYVASYHAKVLSSKQSWIIAIIYSDNLGTGLSHPHFSIILEYFKQEVERNGYEVTFVNRNVGNNKMTYLEFCNNRKVDGVFLVNFYSYSKQLPELAQSGIPIVSTEHVSLDLTTVTSNDYLGGKKAAEYLVNLGHTRKVYHISGPLANIAAQKRLQGFIEVMNERFVEEYKIFEAPNFGFEDGYSKALDIIKSGFLPTAVFVAGDWMALGAIKAFQENGIMVPKDISIIGFDNIEFLKYSNPALTTVAQNRKLIGETAARNLMDKIAGKEVESSVIDVEIIERETCRKNID